MFHPATAHMGRSAAGGTAPQFCAWLGLGSHRCLPAGTSHKWSDLIQRRRLHFLISETPALEAGMWVPKCPCLIYHHRMENGAGKAQTVALAPTWPEVAVQAQPCISVAYPPQQQAEGQLCPWGENPGSSPR